MENVLQLTSEQQNFSPSSNLKGSKSINLGKEVKYFIDQLNANGDWQAFTALKQPHASVSIWWICQSVLLVVFSTWLVGVSPWFYPVAIVFVSRCIRSWGNQCHDVCHNNVFRKFRWNEILGRHFLMPVMWYDFNAYCADHNHHHAGLGTPDQDPDIIGFDAGVTQADSNLRAFIKVMSPLFFDFKTWRSSAFGQLFTMDFNVLVRVIFWWLSLLGVLAVAFGNDVVVNFIVLWVLSRMTMYHFTKVFAELCDHAFLQPLSVVKYTRTMPKTWLSFFLHPENDNFHIAHHLFPKIPMPNLPKAHQLLLKIEVYRNGQHLSSYFWGKRSVLRGLVGRL